MITPQLLHMMEAILIIIALRQVLETARIDKGAPSSILGINAVKIALGLNAGLKLGLRDDCLLNGIVIVAGAGLGKAANGAGSILEMTVVVGHNSRGMNRTGY